VTPVRLTVVLTHPIQYYAPWFRHLEHRAPNIALTVVHATEPTPEQQGVGFDRTVQWDVPLTEGYRSTTVRPPRPGDRVDSASFNGLDVREIGRAIADTRPDVVLITGWYSVTLVRALFACRRLGVPTLYRGDSHLLSGPRSWKRPLWMAKTRILLRLFDGFLSPGQRVNEYLRWHRVPDYRIFRVPHAVDNEMFAATAARYQDPDARAAARREWDIDPDAFVPLFVGKLVPFKRPLDIVRAAARLGSGVTVLVVGSGPLGGEIQAASRDLGLDVRSVGFLNQTEIGKAYAVADCLTLPSDFSETWGLVVNEALATGLPCVLSSAVGCGPDLLREGETGYIAALGDVPALATALQKVRDRKAMAYDWAPKCREVMAAYCFDIMTEGLVRACRSIIRRSPGPEPNQDVPLRVVACCGQMVIAGGAERMTFTALDALSRLGARVHCIVNGWENFRITPMAEEIGATWSVGPYWYTLTRRRLNPLKIARMAWETLRVSVDLLRESRRIRATHILVPDFLTALRNGPALLWLRARGVRIVSRLQNAPDPGRFYRVLWRWAVNPLIDRFVCNSEFTQQELLAHGVRAEKVSMIPNAVSPRRESWEAGGARVAGRIIFVGQIIPDKGLDLLLEALAILRTGGLDATLDVVGDMDGWEPASFEGYRARLRQRAEGPDLKGAVQFLGHREDVPTLMGRASVHCCPSRPEIREAFGLVVLEAKLSGLPSVVLPSGNLPSMIDHRRSGWVCAQATPADLAEGLAFFLTDQSRLSAARAAAAASAANYSEERFASAWAAMFARPTEESICV
jgi:glycosyltransferase involved in cell wall biosynthesis